MKHIWTEEEEARSVEGAKRDAVKRARHVLERFGYPALKAEIEDYEPIVEQGRKVFQHSRELASIMEGLFRANGHPDFPKYVDRECDYLIPEDLEHKMLGIRKEDGAGFVAVTESRMRYEVVHGELLASTHPNSPSIRTHTREEIEEDYDLDRVNFRLMRTRLETLLLCVDHYLLGHDLDHLSGESGDSSPPLSGPGSRSFSKREDHEAAGRAVYDAFVSGTKVADLKEAAEQTLAAQGLGLRLPANPYELGRSYAEHHGLRWGRAT